MHLKHERWWSTLHCKSRPFILGILYEIVRHVLPDTQVLAWEHPGFWAVVDTVDIEGVESGKGSKETFGTLSCGSLPSATKLPLKSAWNGSKTLCSAERCISFKCACCCTTCEVKTTSSRESLILRKVPKKPLDDKALEVYLRQRTGHWRALENVSRLYAWQSIACHSSVLIVAPLAKLGFVERFLDISCVCKKRRECFIDGSIKIRVDEEAVCFVGNAFMRRVIEIGKWFPRHDGIMPFHGVDR